MGDAASAPGSASDSSWRSNLVTDPGRIADIAQRALSVAVLGIKPEDRADQPAHFVAAYIQAAGVRVVPVPTFYPDITSILGESVVRDLADVPRVDILDVFRRPSDIAAHVPEILAMPNRPGCVWLQSGCGAPDAEEALARAGLLVIADKCLMVEHRAAMAAAGAAKL
ncbi:hypothetical protein FOA52_006697 [Chlamydomonas sp. UWO 241]|nr:hypothetical protein FOA52_006697 [Chlamydomonas sp. UWO 241]